MPKMKPEEKPHRPLIRLDVDARLHDEVRLAAARRKISMAEFARQAVAEVARKVNLAGDKS